MENLDKIYSINESIKDLRLQAIQLLQTDPPRSVDLDSVILIRFNNIQTQYRQLTHQRNQEIKEVYSQTRNGREFKAKLNEITVLLVPPKLKVTAMIIGKKSANFTMTPKWFQSDDESIVEEKIKYPSNVKEKRPFNTVARFRAARTETDPTNDFTSQPIEVKQDSTETLILALDAFVQQFGGKLSFTNEDLSFEESAHRTACGVADLGSAHLLSSEHIPSAKFALVINLNYDDIAKSEETMENFILAFVDAVANDLQCDNDYVRISSVEKSTKDKRKAEVNLVLTTPDKEKTEELAEIFKVMCTGVDFYLKKELNFYFFRNIAVWALLTTLFYIISNGMNINANGNLFYHFYNYKRWISIHDII